MILRVFRVCSSRRVFLGGYRLQTASHSFWVQVNEFVKRIRAAKIHIMIMGHLRKQMPAMMGKQKAQEKMMRNLADHFSLVQREHHLPLGVDLNPT